MGFRAAEQEVKGFRMLDEGGAAVESTRPPPPPLLLQFLKMFVLLKFYCLSFKKQVMTCSMHFDAANT